MVNILRGVLVSNVVVGVGVYLSGWEPVRGEDAVMVFVTFVLFGFIGAMIGSIAND